MEVFISVDVEASGPIPGEYSLLSLGACKAGEESGFIVELRPVNEAFDKNALDVVGKSLEHFRRAGEPPEKAMKLFLDWIKDTAAGGQPVFVGFNAAFDWSFVNYYFLKYLDHNPVGFAALDIKSYYAGLLGCAWEATRSSRILKRFKPPMDHTHNALADAIEQGIMFSKMAAYHRKG